MGCKINLREKYKITEVYFVGLKSILMSSLILLTICSCGNRKKIEGGLLWEISGNGIKDHSYLIGTNHGMHCDFLDSIPGVFEALNSVKQIAVESDNSIPKKLNLIKPVQVYLPTDTTYSDLLDEMEFALLDSILLFYYDVNAEKIRFNPNVLMVRLGARITKKESQKWAKANPFLLDVNNTSYNIDSKLKRIAKEKHLPIVELDSEEELDRLGIRDMSILFSSEKLQERAKELVQSIREIVEDSIEMKLVRKGNEAYYNQDLALIEEILTHPKMLNSEKKKLIYETINTKRNLYWIDKIKSAISEQSTFIMVGVAHLPGQKGIINLLRSEGYKVKPVKWTKKK